MILSILEDSWSFPEATYNFLQWQMLFFFAFPMCSLLYQFMSKKYILIKRLSTKE